MLEICMRFYNNKLAGLAMSIIAMIYVPIVKAELPELLGKPIIDTPVLLDWPLDIEPTTPDLSEPTSNRIFDLHARVSDCDNTNIVLSTAGNYHMALRDLWYDQFLPSNEDLVGNWYYTTSPPISPEQIQNKTLTFGNVRLECLPSVAVGPAGLMQTLKKLDVIVGEPVPVIRNYGNVILVKKGNPKKINSIWDLGRADIKVVTSNPDSEKGSFTNYSESIYNIAANDPYRPSNWTAEKLYNVIFNNTLPVKNDALNKFNDKSRYSQKWLSGKRIHHREVPWSVAYGQADAGLMFYHLGLYMVRTFPDLFEIVPLGGTVDDPQPVDGNKIATLFIAKISGDFTDKQLQAREALIDAYLSTEFDVILQYHGLRRPLEFIR